MSEATGVMKFLAVIAIVAGICAVMGEPNLGGSSSAPQLYGWNDLALRLTNPLSTLTLATLDWSDCTGTDPFSQIGCWLGNIARAIYAGIYDFVAILIWTIMTLIYLGIAICAAMTLTFVPTIPWGVQIVLWAFTIPGTFLTVAFFVKTIRGSGP